MKEDQVTGHGDISSNENAEEIPGKEISSINDPAIWIVNDELRDHITRNGFDQNINADFSNSRRIYNDCTRYFSTSFFHRTLLNGEKTLRPWLVYSGSKGVVYCAPCILFGGESSFANDGFNDWKNAGHRIAHHENSNAHHNCSTQFKDRAQIQGKIDTDITFLHEQGITYWRNVLKRVVAAIKCLASRGLPFRGDDEQFGSQQNGNYMMLLELIAQFDPFLAEHISRFGNKGSGSTSYLSKTTCDEFIKILGKKVQDKIVEEIKIVKYYSIIVDSSPDISHVDQLSFIIRYVKEDGVPVERFLQFVENPGHKAENLENAILSTLESLGIDINDCRGQAYDNAANISGPYTGLQARIKEVNKYADYTPCAAHSLNLVGKHAAESCLMAVTYFSTIQNLYNFFSGSTHRWEILTKYCAKSKRMITIKSLSVTRWSAQDDAVHALEHHFPEVISALDGIENDTAEKCTTRNEAFGIRQQLELLETAFMQQLWSFLLSSLNLVSKKLQNVKTTIVEVIELFDGLNKMVDDTRKDFDSYEEKALAISVNKEYQTLTKRKKTRKLRCDESRDGDVELVGRENFRINTFNVILDRISSELQKRSIAYQVLNKKFSVITNMHSLNEKQLREKSLQFKNFYDQDIEASFENEMILFQSYCVKKNVEKNPPMDLLKLLRSNELHTVFPNVDIAYRMLVCTPISNCSAERSFSVLRRVKNYLRSKLAAERLNALALLAIESNLLMPLDCNDIINNFAIQKSRRKNFK